MTRTTRMTSRLSLILALCAASPLAAFEPPSGCTGKLTVQYQGCFLSNIWTCEGDAEGEQWIALFAQDGPYQVRKVDREFQWLQTFYMNPPSTEVMQTPVPDPENLTELFATGEDLYDFTIQESGGSAVRYQGYDRLPGEAVVIDGEPLLRTEFSYQAMTPEGEVLYSRMGRQYVSEKHRLFFFGSVWDPANGEGAAEDTSPVEFIYPGEPGFMSSNPKHGCGEMVS